MGVCRGWAGTDRCNRASLVAHITATPSQRRPLGLQILGAACKRGMRCRALALCRYGTGCVARRCLPRLRADAVRAPAALHLARPSEPRPIGQQGRGRWSGAVGHPPLAPLGACPCARGSPRLCAGRACVRGCARPAARPALQRVSGRGWSALGRHLHCIRATVGKRE